MDNRLKFLYRIYSEMWGHRWKVQPGNGKTGASEVGEWQAKPPFNLKT